MMKGMTLTLLALICCSSACAQETPASTASESYETNLSRVYGAIRTAKMIGELCTERFPDQGKANSDSYAAWQHRHLPFMEEIEAAMSSFALKSADGDPQKHARFISGVEAIFSHMGDAMRTEMKASMPEEIARRCELYPKYLELDRMDLEKHHAKEMIIVRRGPEN